MNTELFLKGERIPKRGYEPSDALKSAIVTFAHAVRQRRPDAIIEFGQTDRDVEISVRIRVDKNSPFMQNIVYFVWEEDGKICGAKAEGGFSI